MQNFVHNQITVHELAFWPNQSDFLLNGKQNEKCPN